MASSAAEALRIENKHRADECWVDEKWMEANWKNGDTLGYAKD